METLLPVDPQMAAFDDAKLVQFLAHASGPIRARALPTLGARIAAAPALKEAVFTAAADPVNLSLALYTFVKVAWVAAMTVLDRGTTADFLRLTQVIAQWPAAEREGFLFYIKDYQGFDKLMHEAAVA